MRSLVAGLVVVAFLTPACGGGGGGGEPALDLSGWWAVQVRFNPGLGDYGLSKLTEAHHVGAACRMGCLAYAVAGTSLTTTTPAGKGGTYEYALEVVSPDRLEGQRTFVDGEGVPQSVHELILTRTGAPAGILRYQGRVLGTDYDVDSQASYGFHLDDWDAQSQWGLRLFDERVGSCLMIGATSTTDPATIAMPWALSVDVNGGVRVVVGPTDVRASAGQVVLTEWTEDRVVGTLDVMLDDGGSLAGSFDLDVVPR